MSIIGEIFKNFFTGYNIAVLGAAMAAFHIGEEVDAVIDFGFLAVSGVNALDADGIGAFVFAVDAIATGIEDDGVIAGIDDQILISVAGGGSGILVEYPGLTIGLSGDGDFYLIQRGICILIGV